VKYRTRIHVPDLSGSGSESATLVNNIMTVSTLKTLFKAPKLKFSLSFEGGCGEEEKRSSGVGALLVIELGHFWQFITK